MKSSAKELRLHALVPKYFALLELTLAATICRYDGEVVDETEVYNLYVKNVFVGSLLRRSLLRVRSSLLVRRGGRYLIFQNGC